jgi:chaperone protein hscC
MGKMIGIDLRTTNSLATYIDDNGEIQFIKNEYGNIFIKCVEKKYILVARILSKIINLCQ